MSIFDKKQNIKSDNTKNSNVKTNLDLWDTGNSRVAVQEEGELISENRKGFSILPEDFGPLQKYVTDNNITDIDFNGTDLWLTDINNKHWKDTETKTSPAFIRRLAQSVANSEAVEFNQKNPALEAESEDLRISIMHNSVAVTGTSICIRKTPKKDRITEKYALETGYCSRQVLSLLVNCIKAHMNIVICGEPRAGKTECAKFLSGFIPDGERVITIEDVMEWHYKALHPTADVIEIKVNGDFTYSDGIIASLKQNPKWLMIAETRGQEVKNLLQGFTTGVKGITTLHTDDVRKIPERMINMANDSMTASRMENNIYEFVDVGVFISMHSDGNGGQVRIIDQVAFFANDNDNKQCYVVVEDGRFYRSTIPEKVQKKFRIAGIANYTQNDVVDKHLQEQGYTGEDSEDEIELKVEATAFEDEHNISNNNSDNNFDNTNECIKNVLSSF